MTRTHLFAVQAYEGNYIPFKGKYFVKVLWNYKSKIETYGKVDGYKSEGMARNAARKLAEKYNGMLVVMEDMQEALKPEEVKTSDVETAQPAVAETSVEVTENAASESETVQSEESVEQGLTLPEALQQSSVVYKRDGDGYYVASKANFSGGYFLDFKSFDPLKHSSVSTSQYHVSVEDIAQHTAKGWQLDKPTPDTLVRFTVEISDVTDKYYAIVATPDGVRHSLHGYETVQDLLDDVARLYGVNTINTDMQRVQECSQWPVQLQHATKEEPMTRKCTYYAECPNEASTIITHKNAKPYTDECVCDRHLEAFLSASSHPYSLTPIHQESQEALPSWARPDEQHTAPLTKQVEQQQMQGDITSHLDMIESNHATINTHLRTCRNCQQSLQEDYSVKAKIEKYITARLLTGVDVHRTVYYGYAPIGLDEPEQLMTREKAIDSLSLILATETRIDDEVSMQLEDIKQWLEQQKEG